MKYFKTPLLILLLFSPFSLSAQINPESDSYEKKQFMSGLNGKVSQVKTTYLFSGNRSSADTASYIMIDKYNTNGWRTGQQMFSIDHTLIGSMTPRFDAQGLIGQADYTDMYGYLITRVIYSYDNNGNCILVNVYRGAFYPKSQITYRYNSQNQPVEIVKYNSFNFPVEREELAYNNKGQNTIKKFSDGRGKLIYTITLQYDSANQVTDYTQTGKNGETNETYSAIYGPQGNMLSDKITTYTPTGITKKITTYDLHSNPLTITVSSSQTVSPYISIFKYIYDKQGNWIRKQISEQGLTTAQATRVIDYY